MGFCRLCAREPDTIEQVVIVFNDMTERKER